MYRRKLTAEERIRWAESMLANAKTAAIIDSLSAESIVSVIDAVIDGAVGNDSRVSLDVRKSLARCARHWEERGSLKPKTVKASLPDGTTVDAMVWTWVSAPNPTEAEKLLTWEKLGENRAAWYGAAVELGRFMPSEIDRAVGRKPAEAK